MLFQNVKISKRAAKDKSFFDKARQSKIIFCLGAAFFSFLLISCQSPPKIDLRKFTPVETIVYLETNDLAKTLGALTENQAFRELAAEMPDFSALKNIQLAIAVTNFDTAESQVSAENSVINFTPRFVAVAETHAWQWQTVALIENQIDGFVRKTYGADAVLEKSDRTNGKFFAWTARDGRKVFAFAAGSQIFFGNDLAIIERYFSIEPSKNQSLADDENLARVYPKNINDKLAFGYVSTAGIAQIARLAGVSVAVETIEEADGRDFVARVLPQILQNTTREIVWTASKTERGIEDVFRIELKPETASVLKQTLIPATESTDSAEYLPADFFSATRYNLKNPLIAWRGLLLLTVQNTDAFSGNLLARFSNSLLEPYGVTDAETFLNSIGTEIVTLQFDADGEKSAAIVTVKNLDDLKKSISKEINFQTAPTMRNKAAVWFSENKQFAAAFAADKLILGESSSVEKCLQARESKQNFAPTGNFQDFKDVQTIAATRARDADSVEKIVNILAERKDTSRKLATFYNTETRVNATGIERRIVSDFGLIGTVLKQLEN